jgi:hypothetical protein
MADEVVFTYSDQVTLEATGASAASDAYVQADDDDLDSGNHGNFPCADFALNCSFGAAVAAGKYIALYRRDLNIDGTGDAPEPASTYPHQLVGLFNVASAHGTETSYYSCPDVPLTKECQFWIQNKTDQNLAAAWTLKATPKTVEPAT